MVGGTWSHLLARRLVTPLKDSWITPNHLTTMRLLTGLGACLGIASGVRSWEVAGGVLWVISTFLDYTDGELARVSGKSSRVGHLYDYATDVLCNALFFVSLGIGASGGMLGWWAMPMGVLAGVSIVAASMLAEAIEKRDASGAKLVPSAGGFDLEHIMYLFGPAAWAGMLLHLLVGAAIGAPLAAIGLLVVWYRGAPAAALPR
jgi:archaetidylinositol phosphate synthase